MRWKKFALRMCTRMWDLSYDELLANTELPSLKARRTQASLCHLFKIIYGLTEFADAPVHHQSSTHALLINLLFVCHSLELDRIKTHFFQLRFPSGTACQRKPLNVLPLSVLRNSLQL